MKRSHISLRTKLASALVVLFKIPYEHAKQMTEDQVLSLAHWDHYPITKEAGGSDTHYNLVPMEIILHRVKTATVDAPLIAKGKRVRIAQDIHNARMMKKSLGYEGITAERRKKHKIPQRKNPWPPKGSRKIRNRTKRPVVG